MKRKVLSSFLVFVMLFSLFHIPLSEGTLAVFAVTEGTVISESDLTWLNLGDGKARITGYSGEETHNLIIPDKVVDTEHGQLTVTEIGAENSWGSPNSEAFNNKGLTGSITIPDGVTTIGFMAFQNNELTTVIFPNSVTTIAREAFDNNQITAVTIPDSVTNIGAEAFRNNSFQSICDLDLPSHLDYYIMGNSLHHIIETPENFVIPSEINGNEVTGVPNISGSYDIKSVIMPETVTSIGAYDFDLYQFELLEKVIFLREGTDWTIDNDVFASREDYGGGIDNSTPDTIEIVGHPSSTAETFAQQKGFPFVDVSTITIPTNPTCGEAELNVVTYDGNGNTGGTIPTDSNSYTTGDTVKVLGNTGSLMKTSYSFGGWNTTADGSGTTYAAEETFSIGPESVTLYAKWLSSNADLSNISLSSGTLNSTFDEHTLNYTATVEHSINEITVTVTKADSKANVVVNGSTAIGAINLNVGSNTIEVEVTAEDGTTKTYTITITREATSGDGNGDGVITTQDVFLLSQYLNGTITLTEAQKKAIDMNGDGVLNQADLLLVMQAYLAS